jgi:murein L,D-transpeptidase YafK
MPPRCFRAAGAALCLLALSVAAADELAAPNPPHPEDQLLAALDALNAGKVDEAWKSLDDLVRRQPNFRLAQLFYGEVQAARSNGTPPRDLASLSGPEIDVLVEEARLRLQTRHAAITPGAVPDVLLHLSRAHRHAVVVDLPRARLYLVENRNGELRVVRDYYASIGKGGWGKKSTGDNRTPVGIYHITGFIKDQALPELYGAGAFPVSYPNVWDRRLKYTGSGIWLHGVPRDTYNRAPRSSEGCVTLANADLMDLAPFLVEGETPVVLADSLAWRPREENSEQRAEFMAQVEGWRARWSAKDTEAYLAYYADDFETEGMQKPAFAAHKRRVNAGKRYIDVQLEDVDLFRYPGPDGLMLARFTQRYRSDNFNMIADKEQFWRRRADGSWEIVKEASR